MNSRLQTTREYVCNNAKGATLLFVALLSVFLICLPLVSQTSQGAIAGGVFDQSGGAIVDAMVTVIDVARGITRALTTDGAGQYVATNLTPGTYTVRAEAKGFQTVAHSGVLVEVGQNIRVDLVVQPGEQAQTITVTGEIPAIDTTDATLGGTVSNRSILELPLNGRNFQRLLDLRPGTVSSPGAATGSQNSNGHRADTNGFRMEGIIGIPTSTGASLLNANYRGGDSSSLVPIDSIQEFNSMANPKAEYGFRTGDVINVGIKSGTNGIHGTAYAFGRDASATDSPNFFTGQVTPAQLEQFGATAGGPVLKDKLFWFLNFEGIRDQNGNTSTVTAPTSVPGAGIGNSWVDTCLSLGAAKINPLSAQIAGLNPNTCVVSAASPTVENMFPYITSQTTTYFPGLISSQPLNNGIAKGDYVLGPHHHLSGLVYISKSISHQVPSVQLLPQYWTEGVNNAQQYSGDWTWTPNSTWVNDFRLGYVFVRNKTINGDIDMIAGNPWPNGYGIPSGVTYPLYGGSPTITFTSFSGVVGANARSSTGGPQGDVDLVESVSYLRGNQAFKFGFEYLKIIYDHNNYSNATGTVNFTTLQSFLQGTPNNGSIFLGLAPTNGRDNWYGGFFQDDWRIRPRVTLNLGLRYDIYAPITERQNYLGNFNPDVNPATTPAVQQVGPGAPLRSLYNMGKGYVEPRLGVAWDLRGNGKTVVRAGIGLHTDGAIASTQFTTTPFGANFPSIGINRSGTAVNINTFSNFNLTAAQINWNTAANQPAGVTIFPSTATQTIGGVTYTGLTCTAANPCQTGAVEPNYTPAKSIEWNVDIQRAITSNLTLDVAYVGQHGYDEPQLVDLNQAPIGSGYTTAVIAKCIAAASTANCTPDPNGIAAAQPYTSKFPYLSQIDAATSVVTSNYNALQTTLQARGYHGLSFLAGYTYSHALIGPTGQPTTIGVILPSDSTNIGLDYGNATWDLRHRFLFSPTYNIPGRKAPGQMLEGWAVNAILTLQTGLHYSVADMTRTDWLGDAETLNQGLGGGSLQFWNFVGLANAFANNATAPTKLTGNAALGDPTCLADAQTPYAGNVQLQGLARSALFNGGCYKSGSGVLTPPAYGTLGDAGEGFFVGPSYRNVDFSVSKLWRLKERYSAQFRLEFFNLFNRTDFGAPGADPSKSSFGFASGTPDSNNPVLGSGGPRHIQFGLKLTY